MIGSVHGLLLRRLEETGIEGVKREIIDDLMYVALRPYIGHEAALREASGSPSPA